MVSRYGAVDCCSYGIIVYVDVAVSVVRATPHSFTTGNDLGLILCWAIVGDIQELPVAFVYPILLRAIGETRQLPFAYFPFVPLVNTM